VELRPRAPARRLSRLLLALVLVALAAPAGAQAADPKLPPSQQAVPRGYRLSADDAVRIADRSEVVRRARDRGVRLDPTGYTKGPGRWQVSYFSGRRERVQVQVDDSSGRIVEQWSGHQVAWTMARGYEGQFGRKLNAPYVWLPLCVLFLLPFVDARRPFRRLHLDLLLLLGFGVSHFFFNRGDIGVSVPLAAIVLALLLVRLLFAGRRGDERREPLVPLMRRSWLAVGLVLLVIFRVGLNVADSQVIDVGYAGVIGADRIADGDPLYGPGFSDQVSRGDTYGPFNYLTYLPFEQALPWSGEWDDLPAAHGAAIAFDLLTLAGLVLLGRRLRPGVEGRTLGLALGWAWATYPYALFALQSNSNDSLVAAAVVGAMLALTARRPAASTVGGALAVGLGAAAKFAPLLLAPLLAAGAGDRSPRRLAAYALALAAVLAGLTLPFVPDGGVGELWERTIGYQGGRPSPFSVWGLEPALRALQVGLEVGVGVLALLLFFVPRRRSPTRVAALGAALLVALQLAAGHWFYLYVVWFAPLALVAFLGSVRPASTRPHSESGIAAGSVVERKSSSTAASPAGSSR